MDQGDDSASGLSLQLLDMEKFSSILGEVLILILDFPIHVCYIYIQTFLSAQIREKAAR